MKFAIHNHAKVEAQFVPETQEDVEVLESAGIPAEVGTSVTVLTTAEEYPPAKRGMVKADSYTGRP